MPAIAHAIKVSQKGKSRALEARNIIQKGEMPAERPSLIGKIRSVEKVIAGEKPLTTGQPAPTGRPAGLPASKGGGKGR